MAAKGRMQGDFYCCQPLPSRQNPPLGKLTWLSRVPNEMGNRNIETHGIVGLLTSRWAQQELGVKPEQFERIRERGCVEEERLQDELARLKAKAQDSVVEELTAEQRQKLKSILGND
jgi:hypothetical protein